MGYQSVDDNDTPGLATNGLPRGDGDDLLGDDACTAKQPERMASKVCLVAVGVVLGCVISANGSRFIQNRSPVTSSDLQHIIASSVTGKSFQDSLPFEETALPANWNPALPRHGLPLLGAPVTSSVHLLYHAHESAFGLLYDRGSTMSPYSLDYFLINSGGFDAQINQAYCAVATSAAVLNSLKLSKRFRSTDDLANLTFDLPVDPRYDPYPYATQRDILDGECVWNNVIEVGSGAGGGDGSNIDGVFKPPYGMSLLQTSKLIECHTKPDWDVTVRHVDPDKLSLSTMRFEIQTALLNPYARVLINYDRKGIGQTGGGHFSPLGAYNAETDSFLIIDVAKYKFPPVWVTAQALYNAMATVDRCGSYDFPRGQEKLTDNKSDGSTNRLFNPITEEEYERSLKVLNCEARKRGYLILKKKSS